MYMYLILLDRESDNNLDPDTTDTVRLASCIDLHLAIDSKD